MACNIGCCTSRHIDNHFGKEWLNGEEHENHHVGHVILLIVFRRCATRDGPYNLCLQLLFGG